MREKKFKVWDKRTKQMCCVIEIRIGSMVYLKPKVGHPFYRDITDVDVLDYTGLKDKHKREIYEGDILCMNPVDDEWYDVVVFQNGKFELKSCMHPDGDFHLADWCYSSSNPGLIVGNIYEHNIKDFQCQRE